MPLFGPPNIEKMTASRDVKGLVKVLKGQSEPRLRAEAIQALLQIGDGQAVEPLYEARSDDNPGVRALVAIALGYFGDTRAVPLLINSLDIGGEVSVKLLGMLGGAEAVGPLIRILENSYHAKSDANIIAAAEMLANMGDERAIPAIIYALRVGNAPVKPAMIKALTAFGGSAAGPLITTLTEGRRSSNSWYSVRDGVEEAFLALGDAAREALVDSLDQSANFELLKDKVSLLRKMDGGLDSPLAKAADVLVNGDKAQIAAIGPEAEGLLAQLCLYGGGNSAGFPALLRIWDASAVDRLIEFLRDDKHRYDHARQDAIRALGDLGDEKAIPILAEVLQGGGGEPEVALEALGKFKTPGATQAMESLLDLSTYDPHRVAAAKALAERSYTPRRDKAAAVYYLAREEWDRFAGLGEEVTAPVVTEVLEGSSNLVTITLLEHINDPRTVDKLIRMLDSYDEKQRIAACHALGAKGDARAIEALEKLEAFDAHFEGGSSGSSNPWAYDHTGGGSDYWSEEEKVTYPVREAAHAAIEAIKQKTA